MMPPIIYEGSDVLAIDKLAGREVYDLLAELSEKYPGLELVHRLDKDTSGVLLFAKNQKMVRWLKKQFQERQVRKIYRAIVVGNLRGEEGRTTGTITAPVGRHPTDPRRRLAGGRAISKKRDAITHYKILKNFPAATYLEVHPETGRTHQIRAHFEHLGHPVWGDKLYGDDRAGERQLLHAEKLKFNLPDGRVQEINAPLPADFEAVLDRLAHS